MGDAADDLYGAEMERAEMLEAAYARGDRPCPICSRSEYPAMDCKTCGGFGWINKRGEPTEPW